MITLHRFYADEQTVHDSFVNEWERDGREDWTDEQMEELWEKYINISLEADEIFGMEPQENNTTKIYFDDEYGGWNIVKESVDEINKMIEAEEAEIKAANEERKLNLLHEIFDFFMDTLGLYDGGPNCEEKDRKFFIETFKDKL